MTSSTPGPWAATDDPPLNPGVLVAASLAVIAALTVVDIRLDDQRIVIATVLVGPFIAALGAAVRAVAAIGVLAVAVVAASGAWNDNFSDADHWLRLLVAGLGAAFAVAAADLRERLATSRRRFALLSELAELGDGSASLAETVDRLADLLVPAFADVAVVDVAQGDAVRRLGVRACGPRAREIEAWLAGRPPADAANPIASRSAIGSGRVHLIERFTPEIGRSMADDEHDAEMIGALRARSSMILPLRTHGRVLGALSLSVTEHSGRRYDQADADFATVAAGRAALALDNAGLYAELETAEARLGAALDSLTDAVTIQTANGRLMYVNDAAAASMGYESAREMMATPPAEIVARWDTFREDGSPLDASDLPGRAVLRGEDPGPLLLRAVERATGEERWSLVKATAVRDSAGTPIFAVNVIEDVTATRRAEFATRLLARAGEVLASSMDYERTLQQVAELAVPELADWCAVSLPDRQGFLRQVAVAHVDASKVRWARQLAARYPTRLDTEGGTAQVLREGRSQVYNEISEETLRGIARDAEHLELISRIGMRAALLVPLTVAGRAIGTLTLVNAESGRTFDEADVALVEELARRAGTAVENARLYTERSAIAATLQAGLLPRPLPDIEGWETAALYRPAGAENWVGGDFYDAFRVREGWMVVVGDVAGRGAAAAALTALARHTLRASAQLLDDPLAAVTRLDDELYRRRGGLCTVCCVLLREERATVLCAGHPKPMLVRDGRPSEVGEFGPMIGAVEGATWTSTTIELEPGDVLVTYTDGVIDAAGPDGRFGEQRLQEVLAGTRSAGDAVDRIEAALTAFEHSEQADDTAVVAIERAPVDARAGDGEPAAAADVGGRVSR